MVIGLKGLGTACSALSWLLPGAPACPAPAPLPPSTAAPPLTSTADPPSRCGADVARAITEQLARAPKGRFVPPDTLSYDGGAEVITFRPPSCGPARRRVEHDCDEDGVLDNAVCLYDRRAFEGSRQAIKAPGTRRLNGTGIIMSVKNERPFVFFVKRNRNDGGTCFPREGGYGNVSGVGDQRWVNAHPSLRECPVP
ncbi:hypothetical protein [Streptosporangium carneum]|uniref:Uncharacterized protein n=1 Tax=Streptosporangium carneum TaxID=47481 RepID=A0A9W6I753_9ACTN|nr:hypothetical protein [Streptosporangium carneum]GLK12952.1 hypothetical protein GCM10017600_63620 [Streptosporangium carneum]